jgi:SrtB family sortase
LAVAVCLLAGGWWISFTSDNVRRVGDEVFEIADSPADVIEIPAEIFADGEVYRNEIYEDDEFFEDFIENFIPEIRPEFLELRQYFENDDIVGHLVIPGTGIDYLVVQADDNYFYLERDINGRSSSAGWIFLDYDVNLLGADQNTVIYGHNMNANVKFHSLRNFASYDFFRQHPIIIFNTLYKDTQWEIFSFYEAHISFPYTLINYDNISQWQVMLERFVESSLYNTGVV